MIYPYKKISGLKVGPVVSVALKGRSRWIPFNAFVDSGADFSVFHADSATLLGLSLTTGEKRIVTVGDGNDMAVYLHKIQVSFAGLRFKAFIAFSTGLGAGFNLMGRETFFEKFQVCFNDRDRIFRVTRL